jgi:hypothetical protein
MSIATPSSAVDLVRPDAAPPRSCVSAVASITLAATSLALTLVAYQIVHPAGAMCPVEDIWRGTLIAVTSVGTAVPALACGLFGAVARGSNRLLSLLGLALTGAFGLTFYVLWL